MLQAITMSALPGASERNYPRSPEFRLKVKAELFRLHLRF